MCECEGFGLCERSVGIGGPVFLDQELGEGLFEHAASILPCYEVNMGRNALGQHAQFGLCAGVQAA